LLPDFTKAGEAGFDPYLVDYAKKHVVDPQPDYAFDRGHLLSNLYFVTMTEYEKTIVEAGAHVAFPPEIVDFPLGRAISDASLRQLRVSESEKERFVTFYFNGLREHGFPGEDRMIIPSPHVATYDLKPEMSANEITDAILARLSEDTGYSFVLVNFANADMVGHTGNVAAAIKACETVDVCLGKLSTFLQSYGGVLLITADHGNVEEMIDQTTGTANTEHSANPVPFIAVAQEFLGKQRDLAPGILSDVAPTILHLLGMPVPTTMTGRNLLEGII
jgi:2,3-bisphosphoglycerate-independent phosphoglycerate mutase